MGPAAYLDAAFAAFDDAASRIPCRERHLRLGGGIARLRVAGPALDALIDPAFRHLATEAGPSDLEVAIWAVSEAGAPPPAPPWIEPRAGDAATAIRFVDARYTALSEHGGSQHWMLDRQTGRAVLSIRDLDAMPSWDRLSPLRLLLAAWAGARGVRMMHAGGVGFDGRGVMVAGRGGSGKSTTVLSCIAAGGRTVGDDLLLVEDGPAPAMHSVYGTARLFADHAARFPGLIPDPDSADPAEGGALKLTSYLSVRRAEALVPSLALAAIVLPRVVGRGESRVARVGGAAALAALAPSTLGIVDRHDPGAFPAMARLCRTLPAFDLAIGAEVHGIPAAIRACLQEVGP